MIICVDVSGDSSCSNHANNVCEYSRPDLGISFSHIKCYMLLIRVIVVWWCEGVSIIGIGILLVCCIRALMFRILN